MFEIETELLTQPKEVVPETLYDVDVVGDTIADPPL